MKKGADHYVRKCVYRSVNGLYYREDPLTGNLISLISDFPSIDKIASLYPAFKLCMKKAGMEITAWKDKYNNIIVRLIDENFVQTKINF